MSGHPIANLITIFCSFCTIQASMLIVYYSNVSIYYSNSSIYLYAGMRDDVKAQQKARVEQRKAVRWMRVSLFLAWPVRLIVPTVRREGTKLLELRSEYRDLVSI